MIHYILQTIAFQLLFLLVYDIFLKKETFFNWNRAYLLLTPILSFILPLIKISAIQENIPQEYMIQLPAVVISSGISSEEIATSSAASVFNYFGWEWIWLVGAIVSLVFFGYKIFKIQKLKHTGIRNTLKGLVLIILPKSTAAFSFFNTVFLGEELSEAQKKSILMHEKVHVREGHSLDLLFMETLRVLCWFNPLLYVYQKRLRLVHEYIADKQVLKERNRDYYQDLLSQVFQTEKISFINTFFNHSLIKKRIVMLQKSKSRRIFQLKYLLLVPVITVMLVYTSCAQEANGTNTEDNNFTHKSAEPSQSEILDNIAALKESIAAKGDMTADEEKALKELVVLTSKEGVNHFYFDDVKDQIEIPFGVIDKVPVYPGCENLSEEESKKCFTKKISAFIGENFKVENLNDTDLTGRQKIAVSFVITNKGDVVIKKIKTNHPVLEAEARRTMSQLPKMQPGEQDGKKVAVQYAIPIIFAVK